MLKNIAIALLICLTISACSTNKRAKLSSDWHKAVHQVSDDAGNVGHAIVKGSKNIYKGSKEVVEDLGDEIKDMADEVKDDLY